MGESLHKGRNIVKEAKKRVAAILEEKLSEKRQNEKELKHQQK